MARDDIELAPGIRIICADCKEVLPDIGLVDAVVTDPPYGLSFMGKKWDYDIPSVEIWQAILECLKPGGHLLAFAGTRTQHRMACAIEDAGFDIRDCLMWHYSQGFPKSLDISKAIDRMAGAEREVLGQKWADRYPNGPGGNSFSVAQLPNGKRTADNTIITDPATPEAQQWAGWGTALKPATEIITMARKPLDNCTVAENVLKHGTGGINVDGCRIGTNIEDANKMERCNSPKSSSRISGGVFGGDKYGNPSKMDCGIFDTTQGRWPANLIHDGSEEVLRLFPVTTTNPAKTTKVYSYPGNNPTWKPLPRAVTQPGSSGSAARFFYTAKASKSDRDDGCEGLEAKTVVRMATQNGVSGVPSKAMERFATASRNYHPTVKPTALMRYLCRLITPPKGIILDPFMGSGSTGKAAIREGFKFIGIERDREYFEIARKRIEAELKQGRFDF